MHEYLLGFPESLDLGSGETVRSWADRTFFLMELTL